MKKGLSYHLHWTIYAVVYVTVDTFKLCTVVSFVEQIILDRAPGQ